MRLDPVKIAKLRSRGLLEQGPTGSECVRISVQQCSPLDVSSRAAARAQVEAWARVLAQDVAEFGGLIVPGSLSVTAQMVEALVPVEKLVEAGETLEGQGARVDLVEPRQAI